jgi:hypothetical protein
MKWVDLARVCLALVLGFVAAAIRSAATGTPSHVDGGELFVVAMLIAVLWAIRDGQEAS